MTDFTLAELCAVACAEAWRGDGEILASPIGIIPTIGARLAKATFAPDLMMTDGVASLVANVYAVGAPPNARVVEGWMPYRSIFDLVWSGRRHVMMGASQIDRFGNQNIACIGDYAKPKSQLLGVRGAPGNTVNHTTSYWIPQHSTRAFVPKVDFVSGVGYDRARALGPKASRFHEIRRVVTDKAVLDFHTPAGLDANGVPAPFGAMRLRSVHPGVSVDDVVKSTGFELVVANVTETRAPTSEELRLIREVIDPNGLGKKELAR
jgi:acyl CoA:acetate/3-ketoacid CoA transferase beta subunit